MRPHPCRIRHENYKFSKSASDNSSQPCQTDDFSTQTFSADDKENSCTALEFGSDDETGPEDLRNKKFHLTCIYQDQVRKSHKICFLSQPILKQIDI